MRKARSVRKALHAAIPEIRDEPDRLAIWIEDGSAKSTQTESYGFRFDYPLSVLVRETSTDISIITLAIMRWLRVNEPALLAPNGAPSFSFETDILDNGTADILFTLALSENVAVTPNEDGSWKIDYLEEPDPLFTDLTGFEAVDPIPLLAEVRLTDSNG